MKIARDWNIPASGSGYVTRFQVRHRFLDCYGVKDSGARAHGKCWVPAEELDALDAAIIGDIEVTAEFGP